MHPHSIGASPIRVWIIEDNRHYRRELVTAIRGSECLQCEGDFSSCETALAALKEYALPDVFVLDIGLPGMSGTEGIPLLRTLAPRAELLVLTVFEDDEKIFRAICAGATGYLLKDASMEEIVAAIRLTQAGGSPMSPRVARRVLGHFSARTARPERYGLTSAEQRVLEQLVTGAAKKEIADRLSITIHTVDMHCRHIYEKLQVHSATGAVAKALKEGIA